MGHSYTLNTYHIIFSTKDKSPVLNEEVQQRLYPYLAAIINKGFGKASIINGVEDHLHILCTIKAKYAISDVLCAIKSESSKWINNNFEIIGKFQWQTGYGCFSVSASQFQTVYNYIKDQKEHHRQNSFKEEFKTFLDKHGLEPFEDEY